MSGGAEECTMSNIVDTDGTTMISKYSNYTTSTYPDNKYYDKYSYSTNYESRKGSKLGDGIKEVYKLDDNGWYSDDSYFACSYNAWFARGGKFNSGSSAGVFASINSEGSSCVSRPVITPFLK